MASPSLPSVAIPSPRFHGRAVGPWRPPTVRAHARFPDEGNSWSSDVVEANLDILRERIEVVQIKERLELTCSTALRLRMMTRPPSTYGWNYYGDAQLSSKSRRPPLELVYQFLRLVALVSSTVGVTCFSGTCLLYLVSILTHHF